MKHTRWSSVFLLLAVAAGLPTAAAQPSGPPSPEQIARMRAVGTFRSWIGTSGLRRFLSESASLGELQNRASSYRMIEQVERARVAQIEGTIAAVSGALRDPRLPNAERIRIEGVLEASRTELVAVPSYRARYATSTGQVGTLTELGFLGSRPAFLLVKGRVVRRTDPDHYLRVLAERVDVAPALFLSPGLFASVGVVGSRSDVDVLPFDGTSGTVSRGLRVDVGVALGSHWAAGMHGEHTWTTGTLEIVRLSPDPVTVESEPTSRVASAKAEVMGSYERGPMAIAPRVGIYAVHTSYDSVTNSVAETSSGPFGDSDVLGMVAAGVAIEVEVWDNLLPEIYLGADRELQSRMGDVLADRTGVVFAGGLNYSIARAARVGITCTYARSGGGRRVSGELDLVAVLDF